MPTYNATIVIDASVNIEVEAESREEAVELALGQDAASPSLCHQCAGSVDVGDVMGVILSDGDREVFDDTPYSTAMEQVEVLRRQLATQQQVLAASRHLIRHMSVVEMVSHFTEDQQHMLRALIDHAMTEPTEGYAPPDVDRIAMDATNSILQVDPGKLIGGETQAFAQLQCIVANAIRRYPHGGAGR